MIFSVPTLRDIENIPLTEITSPEADFASSTTFEASKLWKDGPVLFFMVRRPGCIMCRELAYELSQHLHTISSELKVKVVAVVKENIVKDLEGFREYFKGSIYLDKSMGFFSALTGGKIQKHNLLVTLLSPGLWNGYSRASKKGVVNGSLNGEATINGGFMLVSEKEGVSYMINESVGSLPSFSELIQQIAKVSPVKFDLVNLPVSVVQRQLCEGEVCALEVK